MKHFGDWVRAVGYWWFGAVGFLPSFLSLVGITWLEVNVASPFPFASASLIVLLAGSFFAYRKVAARVDRLEDEREPRFLIRAPQLPTTMYNRLYLLDVYLANRHPNRPLNMRFSLRAGEVEIPGAHQVPENVAGNLRISNPKHIEPGSNHGGFLAFDLPDEATPFVIPGVELVVVDEQTPNFRREIQLPIGNNGYQYPP